MLKPSLVARYRNLAVLVAAVASLAGCAGMASDYEAPSVSVQSFRPIATDDGGGLPTFEIVLHVINPNLEPLELAGISYSISLDDHKLIKGVGNNLPVIEG